MSIKKLRCWIYTCISLITLSCSSYATTHLTIAGHGQPLILIHAFPTDQRLWAKQINGLKPFFRVITLDLIGFGHARATNGESVSMQEYSEQVKELMDELHIKKAIIGGESMGGYIALAFLQAHPDRVQGLILSDTRTGADSAATKAQREATAKDILAHGTEQFIHDFALKALSKQASETDRASLQSIMQEQRATGLASGLRGMAERDDTTYVLSGTNLPILILTGDEDTVISPQESENMHVLAKNSELVIIQHAGHLSSLEQAEQWNNAVINMFYRKNN